MAYTPIQRAGGAYRLVYWDKEKSKSVTFSLGTHNQRHAEAICRDFEEIRKAGLATGDPRLFAFDPRAVEMALGPAAAAPVAAARLHAFDAPDVGALESHLRFSIKLPGHFVDQVLAVLAEYETRQLGQLRENFTLIENELKSIKPHYEELLVEIARLRREKNAHVRTPIGAAVTAWKKIYAEGRKASTVVQAVGAVDSFVASLVGQEKFRLADVRGLHLDDWLAGLRKQARGNQPQTSASTDEREKLAAITKKKLRAYVRGFFSWAMRRYDLIENPVARAEPLAGVARYPEHIRAMRRYADLTGMLAALKPEPYWRAWVAVACLAGPRWAEQAWLKISDVYLEDGYLRIASRASGRRIAGTKTGRERNVPIERAVLLPILTEHVKRREAERARGTTPAAKSEWLFPSAVPENIYKARTKTLPGLWSGGRIFADAWARVVKLRKPKSDAGECWRFGPREWRHTAGTAMGMCGWSSLEIARVLGNSSAICERHYVAPGDRRERWPLKW